MDIYTLDIPECKDFSVALQKMGNTIIYVEDALKQKQYFEKTSSMPPALFLLPLKLSSALKEQTAMLEIAEVYEIPILFIYKRSKRLKEPAGMPKRTIYETLAIPADPIEIKMKLASLENMFMQVLSAKLRDEELENIRKNVQKSLHIAQKFQKLVLPKAIKKEDLEIQGLFQPSGELSGDLYYWMEIEEGEYGCIMIDVCGKGIHASLISMSIRALMPNLIKQVKDPLHITKELNSYVGQLFQKVKKESVNQAYFTAFIAYVNTKERIIEYVNNGHPPALLYAPATEEVYFLDKGSIPIGLLPEMKVEKGIIAYPPGSRFIIYTDGLSESPNHQNIHRFDHIEKEFVEFSSHDTADILQALMKSRMKHSEINDDICMIAGTLF